MTKDRQFPVISELPEHHQAPFQEWLAHQTRPLNTDGTVGFYRHDYERWLNIQTHNHEAQS